MELRANRISWRSSTPFWPPMACQPPSPCHPPNPVDLSFAISIRDTFTGPLLPSAHSQASRVPGISALGMSCLQIPVTPWQAHMWPARAKCVTSAATHPTLLCSQRPSPPFPQHLSALHHTLSWVFFMPEDCLLMSLLLLLAFPGKSTVHACLRLEEPMVLLVLATTAAGG